MSGTNTQYSYAKRILLPAVVVVLFTGTFLHLNNTQLFKIQEISIPITTSIPSTSGHGFVSELAKDPLIIVPIDFPKDRPPFNTSSKSQEKCPPAPFDISLCPSIQEAANIQNIADSVGSNRYAGVAFPKAPLSDRALITYVYAETDYARVDLKFFIKHGLHDQADFVFIFNGATDAETLLPGGQDNIRIVKKANLCFDLGTHAAVLSEEINGEKALKDKYKRFILMNASIRGPFIPHWSTACWSEAYLGRLNEKVKLVGSTINCHSGIDQHVQSMIWALDSYDLAAILEPEEIGECFVNLESAMDAEIRTTRHVRSKGYEVDVMLQVYQTQKDYKFADCQDNVDYLFNNNYYGFNVHPFETLFVKTHRGVDSNMINIPSDWVDASGYSSYDACRK